MEIGTITLISFRNHKKTTLSFDSDLTVIWGKNGSGKTSVLEAIYNLSIGKSFKTNTKKELIKEGEKNFIIKGVFKDSQNIKKEVSYYQNKQGKRKIKINKKPILKRKDLIGLNNVVVFSPEEEKITKGYPKEKRQFFNKLFSICSKEYLNNLLVFNKTLKQRNFLLKNNKKLSTNNIIELLKPWNEKYINISINVWKQKQGFLNDFRKLFNKTGREFDKEIEVQMVFEENKETKESFQKKIEKNIHKEMIIKTTLFGPHKDNIDFLYNNKSLKKHGSQGEHKVFLAILKVAEILFINNKTQSSPIFLIDDLFANLDIDKSKRITAFLNETKKTKKIKLQTIITTTDILKLKKNMFFNNDNNIKKHKLVNGCKA